MSRNLSVAIAFAVALVLMPWAGSRADARMYRVYTCTLSDQGSKPVGPANREGKIART